MVTDHTATSLPTPLQVSQRENLRGRIVAKGRMREYETTRNQHALYLNFDKVSHTDAKAVTYLRHGFKC